jgi:hypothetical protein
MAPPVSRRPLVPSDMIIDHPDAVITVRKTTAKSAGGRYVLSDQSIDRHGDQILASGWDLQDFKKTASV